MATSRQPILYRWWDAEGNLLYIGKSVSVLSRIAAHRRKSKFFDEAASMTMERYPDEITLSLAEIEAIRAEHPPHNVAHNRGYDIDHNFDFATADREALAALDEIMAPAFATAFGRAS